MLTTVVLQVVEYNRLAPLVPLNYSLDGSFTAVKPGDCIVAFSRNDVYQIREKIEGATKQPCALAYGALPPGIAFDCAPSIHVTFFYSHAKSAS